MLTGGYCVSGQRGAVMDIASVAKEEQHMYLQMQQENKQSLYRRAKLNIGIIKFCGLFL
jgi:hypothetical protein